MMRDYDPTPTFAEVHVPVLIAHGRYDFAASHTLWDGEVEKFPNATFRLFERSGHYPHYEQQEAFDALLLDWMSRH